MAQRYLKPPYSLMKRAPDASNELDLLTPAQVADWLQVNPRQLERFGVPALHLGHRTVRYLRKDVTAWLESQRKAS